MSVGIVRKMVASGVAAVELGCFAGVPSSEHALRTNPQIVTGVADEFMQPDVDVLLVNNGVTGDYYSTDKAQKEFEEIDAALRLSTNGVRGLGSISVHGMQVTPEGKKMIWARERYCYTAEQYAALQAQQRARLGSKTISIVAYNTDLSCNNEGVGGEAIRDPNDPKIMLNLFYGIKEDGLHEIGHLLGKETKGLGHQALYSCWRVEAGTLTQAYFSGTIQESAAAGCGVKTNSDGTPDWYASRLTVMADANFAYGGAKRISFTPPELAQLMPNLRTQEIDPIPGKYYLSYQEGAIFGLRLKLPPEHILKQQIPTAESLYFGSVVLGGSVNEAHGFNKKGNVMAIMAFVETSGDNDTVALDTNLYKTLSNEPSAEAEDGISNNMLVYADEQLNLAAFTGTDGDGQYVEIRWLNDMYSQEIMQKVRARVTGVNQQLIQK